MFEDAREPMAYADDDWVNDEEPLLTWSEWLSLQI